jgi:hypothetical protein
LLREPARIFLSTCLPDGIAGGDLGSGRRDPSSEDLGRGSELVDNRSD